MTDDELLDQLRDRVRRAPVTPSFEPGAVVRRARRAQQRRRAGGVAMSVAGVVAVGALALPALQSAPRGDVVTASLAEHAKAPGSEAGPSFESSTESPARDVDGVQVCSSYHRGTEEPGSVTDTMPDGTEVEVGGLEGWFNSLPADADGNVLPVEQWPQRVLDHPAIAQVETRTGTVLETTDRRTCRSIPGYAPPPLATLPPDAIVVLDAETGEVLATEPLEELVEGP